MGASISKFKSRSFLGIECVAARREASNAGVGVVTRPAGGNGPGRVESRPKYQPKMILDL